MEAIGNDIRARKGEVSVPQEANKGFRDSHSEIRADRDQQKAGTQRLAVD